MLWNLSKIAIGHDPREVSEGKGYEEKFNQGVRLHECSMIPNSFT